MDDITREAIEKIKAYRLREKVTQKELANMLGVTQNALSNWMQGKTGISTENAIKIDKITQSYNISVIPSRPCHLDPCPAEPPVDHFLMIILEGWNTLTIEQKAQASALVAGFLEKQDTTSKVV